jgi:hypothetical protein
MGNPWPGRREEELMDEGGGGYQHGNCDPGYRGPQRVSGTARSIGDGQAPCPRAWRAPKSSSPQGGAGRARQGGVRSLQRRGVSHFPLPSPRSLLSVAPLPSFAFALRPIVLRAFGGGLWRAELSAVRGHPFGGWCRLSGSSSFRPPAAFRGG